LVPFLPSSSPSLSVPATCAVDERNGRRSRFDIRVENLPHPGAISTFDVVSWPQSLPVTARANATARALLLRVADPGDRLAAC